METDNELMRRTALGDTTAFDALVTRHRARAEALAAAVTGDKALAQDIAQECFARVYALRREYRPTFSFTAYLTALVRNRAIDALRLANRAPASLDALVENGAAFALHDDAETPEEAFLRTERRALLLDAISRLTPREREFLSRYAGEGQTYADIAREMRVSVAQVRVGLHRLRRKLRTPKEETP